MNARIRRVALAAVSCLLLPLLATSGCSREKSKVADIAIKFVEAIENQDSKSLDRIMDWQRYYAYGKNNAGEAADGEAPLDVETQKNLLLGILARDRGLAMKYLTSDSYIDKISVHGDKAEAVILQVDRANGNERRVTLLLHRDESGGWKVYRFSTEESNEAG